MKGAPLITLVLTHPNHTFITILWLLYLFHNHPWLVIVGVHITTEEDLVCHQHTFLRMPWSSWEKAYPSGRREGRQRQSVERAHAHTHKTHEGDRRGQSLGFHPVHHHSQQHRCCGKQNTKLYTTVRDQLCLQTLPLMQFMTKSKGLPQKPTFLQSMTRKCHQGSRNPVIERRQWISWRGSPHREISHQFLALLLGYDLLLSDVVHLTREKWHLYPAEVHSHSHTHTHCLLERANKLEALTTLSQQIHNIIKELCT